MGVGRGKSRPDRGPEDVRREQVEPKVRVQICVSASGMVTVELPRSVADRVLDEDDPIVDAQEIWDYPGVSEAIMNGLEFEIDESFELGALKSGDQGEDDADDDDDQEDLI